MFYQIAAILILLFFYGCYFGKMISQKRKGIRTNHIGENKQGFVKWIEVTMKITAIAVPMLELVCILSNTFSLPAAARIIGILLALLGDAVFLLSVRTMRDSWRAGVSDEQTELITDGIYQLSRNPAFLGFDLVYLGILLMFFSFPLLLLSAFGMLLFHLQIVNVEEDHLIVAFGEPYLEYRKQVNRYLGRKRRCPMKTCTQLPEGYQEILKVDLQKNKKEALIVNGIALVITVVMMVIGHLLVPVWTIYDNFLQLIMLVLAIIAYILLHELVHGICMKHFSGEKPYYGFTGLYAYAGSDCFFCRKDYVIIALAPIVVWGIVLLALNLYFGEMFFWVFYFIQMLNISGAAGDLYVSWKFTKLPEDILINDVGVSMTVYSKE